MYLAANMKLSLRPSKLMAANLWSLPSNMNMFVPLTRFSAIALMGDITSRLNGRRNAEQNNEQDEVS